MIRTQRRVAVLPLPGLLHLVLVLPAIIVGILGMHILAVPHAMIVPQIHNAELTGTSTKGHAAGAGHTETVPQAHTAMPLSIPQTGEHPVTGCPDCDGTPCLTGACVLFLNPVTIPGVLGLNAVRMLAGPALRGPPRVLPALSVTPTPSLVQLSISRT